MKTSLVILAAGIGSRFGGGIKQLESFGPSGEIIMDYSIHDALEAGFNKVVFIIRKNLEEDFRRIIGERIEKITEVAYAFQELDKLPEGFSLPEGRTKPWGTGHALLCAKDAVDEPFAVINADDYYGKEGFRLIHDFLVSHSAFEDGKEQVCMAGFLLGNTLSDNGGVTRGVCLQNEAGELTGICETKNIVKTADGAGVEEEGGIRPLSPENLVSMNLWGLYPEFMESLETGFPEFLKSIPEGDVKAEYLLPSIVDELIQSGKGRVSVLPTSESWFGVTYHDDIPTVKDAFAKLIADGVYRSPLFAE